MKILRNFFHNKKFNKTIDKLVFHMVKYLMLQEEVKLLTLSKQGKRLEIK